MRCNEVCYQVESNSPPDGPKDVPQMVLQASKEADRMVYLWQVLQEKHY